MSFELFLTLLGIIVAIIVPTFYFFVNRNLKKRKINNTYYSLIWKKSTSLIPKNLGFIIKGLGGRPFNDYYHERPKIDNLIAKCLNQNQNILLKGPPLIGKTRSVYHALKNLKKKHDILKPKCIDIDPHNFCIPNHLKSWRPEVVIIDDLHEFVVKPNFKHFFEPLLNDSINIIATSRSGLDYDEVKDKMTSNHFELPNIFGDNIIEIQEISKEEGKLIADKVDKNWEEVEFNGTPGSIFMKLSEMKRRYNFECSNDEKDILRSLKKLHDCSIYEEFLFPLSWIKIVNQNYAINGDDNKLDALLGTLQKKEFLKIKKDKKIYVESVYLENIIDYGLYEIKPNELYNEILKLFENAQLPEPELDLSSNDLKSLPLSIGNLTFLTKLNLYNNELTSLPESIGNLASLTQLDLSSNKLTSLPESIGNLTSLTQLDLTRNQLTSLPESIGNLISLTELKLYSNKLTSLPESIGNLTSLTELNLTYNKLSSLPECINNLISLTDLNLSSNDLILLPESIGNLTILTKLNLTYNKLTSLPESIGNLKSLTELKLPDNKLKSLPKSIRNLTSLTELDLSTNYLKSLPPSIGNLSSLIKLNLTYNKLASLPESIGNLKSLTELNLYTNKLTSLPESIRNLTSITKLILTDNKLKSLPESIRNLTSITKLDLTYNKLKSLPKIIKQWIEDLKLNGCNVAL